MSKAPLIIFEGNWWSSHEVPVVLPYFNALANTFDNIRLSHRSIRSADDIAYYVSRIPKNAGAMVYFACHGAEQDLYPTDRNSPIRQNDLLLALAECKEGAISFVHFGCCEMVAMSDRRKSHQAVLDATGAKWASGYTKSVHWLRSTLVDLALVSEVFVPDHGQSDGRTLPLKRQADSFMQMYEKIARELGFSALSRVSAGNLLFPERLNP